MSTTMSAPRAGDTTAALSTARREALDSLPATALLTALTTITTIGFCRVFAGWEFLTPMVTVVVGIHLAAAAMRIARLPGYVAIPLQVGVLFALVGWRYYPDTMAGPFPTGTTWDVLTLDVQLAREQFPDAVAPVAAFGGFVVCAAIALGIAAILADAFAFRAYGRAEAVVPSAVLFVFAAALGADTNRVAVTAAWLAAALATIAILRAAHSQSEHEWIGPRGRVLFSVLPLAGILAGCAALGGAVIGPRLPGAGAEGLVDTESQSETVEVRSPLVSIRSRLVNLADTEMFTVYAPSPRYWRSTGLSLFDGEQWKLPKSSLDPVDGSFEAAGARPTETQMIEISALDDVLLPVAYSPVAIDASQEITYVEDTATLVVPDGFSDGSTFTVVSALRDFSPAQLAAATSANPPDDISLDLPGDFPREVADTAREVTSGATSNYDKLLALQRWFHTEFTYDLAVQRGHSDNAMINFLRVRRGYCEQFAGTFAAMARVLGIPSRVAVGYTPGDLLSDGRFHVYGRNAHAWPEVWFDDIGWVSFEPTPGRGEPGAEDYTGNPPLQAPPEGEAGQPIPITTAPPAASNAVPNDPDATPTKPAPQGENTPTTASATVDTSSSDSSLGAGFWLALLAIAAVIAWLTLMPRAMARWASRSASHEAVDIIAASWDRAARSLQLVGLGPHVGETPIEHARRVEHDVGVGPHAMRELAGAATAAIYGSRGDNSTALHCAALSQQIVEAVKHRQSVLQRVVNLFDPRRVRQLAA